MSLISLIQQLQTIQAQLSSPNFNAGDFGHLSQRYAELCVSSVSALQVNQSKAAVSAAAQDLEPDLSGHYYHLHLGFLKYYVKLD